MNNGWPEVDESRPCPICLGDRRCKVTADGGAVRCFRCADAPAGWRKGKSHFDGGATFHRDDGKPLRRPRTRTSVAGRGATKLSSESLNQAYSALIERFSLSTLHRLDLYRRGLSAEEVNRRQYRTMPAPMDRRDLAAALRHLLGDDFSAVPGFGFKDGNPMLFGASGLLIPCRDQTGRIIACKVRADRPSSKTAKYTFLSSKKYGGHGPGILTHVPAGIAGHNSLAILADTTTVRWTEGELKADIAFVMSGIPTISVGGVSTWRRAIELTKSLGAKTVRLAFDADAVTNPDVARPLLDAVRSLPAEGFAVELERWNISDGKGIDDALVAGKSTEVLAGDSALAAALEIAKTAGIDPNAQPPAGGELLDKVKSALEEGGAGRLLQDKTLRAEIATSFHADKAAYTAIRLVARDAGIPLREFSAAIKPDIVAAAASIPAELSRDATGGFFEEAGCICRLKPSMEGPQTVQLCNFTCRIVDETTRDDGAERQTVLGLQGKLDDGRVLARVEVAAEKFQKMEWVIPAWGSDATVWPGEQRALPSAIQALSRFDAEGQPIKKARKLVMCHTGWRKLGGEWAFLHAGAPITGGGGTPEQVVVSLDPPLSNCQLPQPLAGNDLVAAISASLQVLTVCPPKIGYALLAAVYRAVLGRCDFSLSLVGPTGIQKSELAALAQQHFGAGFDARHLPGSWSSTANSIERLSFLAKDLLLVVDDFAPHGSSADVQRYHRDADRVYRAVGNHSARQRMRPDGTLRPSMPPQALILSTGEDVARGQSVRSRQLILEVSKGDVDLAVLTDLQHKAANGMFATAMAGFLQWLAPRFDEVQNQLRGQVEKVRSEATASGQHARTPGIVADLVVGFRYFLKFAAAAGAITDDQRKLYRAESFAAISESASAQAIHQQQSDPALQFVRLLSSAIATGRVHVAGTDGQPPADSPDAWGWRNVAVGSGQHAYYDLRPEGKRIGWIDGVNVYLDPNVAFAEAQKLATEQGESFATMPATLRKRLHERQLLAATDTKRETITVRRTIQGQSRNVLWLFADTLSHDDTASPTPETPQINQKNIAGDAECRVPCREECRVSDDFCNDPTSVNGELLEQNEGFVRSVGSNSGGETYTKTNNNNLVEGPVF